jgi:TetR/AcrR family transcriptional repressor of nem operon
MGRTSDGRERLLEAASSLLRERSYASIGVAQICAAAGVQKGSFYYYFESKQALALAVIDEHWVEQRREWTRVLETGAPLVSQLRELFALTTQFQIASASGTGSVSGCLFGNLALEMSGQDDQIRERIQQIFEEQIALVASAIQAAVASGEISPVADERHVAKSIVAQIEGLVLFAKLLNEPAELDPLLANSMSLLGIPAAAATS